MVPDQTPKVKIHIAKILTDFTDPGPSLCNTWKVPWRKKVLLAMSSELKTNRFGFQMSFI